jgi:hypothetical protein
VKLYEDPDQVSRVVHESLSHENAGAFKLTNPFSKQIWLRELLIALHESDEDPVEDFDYERIPLMAGLMSGDVGCVLATFTHEGWVCPDSAIEFDLAAAKQKVRKALRGFNFIASFEVAYYVNEKWEKNGNWGNLVSFHCHAVVWTVHPSRLGRRRKKIKPRFRPISVLGSKTGVRFDTLKTPDDVWRAVRYHAKMPFYGYRTVSRAGGGKTQRRAFLSYIQRYRLFKALQPYDLLDFWLAGGDGKAIMRSARRKLIEHRRHPHECDLPVIYEQSWIAGARGNRPLL